MSLLDQIKDSGVVGMGGAGFPTHVKLNTKQEYFIVNAAECEPLIETDKYLIRNHADMIIDGMLLIGQHLEAKHLVIALKGKYVEEIKALREAINKKNANIEIFEMGYFYPAGDEQTMVQQVTGRCIPERGLPSDVGCVVDNVGTVIYILIASKGRKTTVKYLSVVGEVKEPVMICTPIGTYVRECVEAAVPNMKDYGVIIGGPMMGKYLVDDEAIDKAVVTKTTGNIIVLPKDHYLFRRSTKSIDKIKHESKAACIQCRMCTDLCPRHLIGHKIRPNLMMRNLWRMDSIKDENEFKETFGEAVNCVSCGVCELYACPMGLSPRKVNDYLKGELRNRKIQVEKGTNPKASEFVDLRKTPTNRLIARLGLSKYYGLHPKTVINLNPEKVFIPFSQHIGAPAICEKKVGDKVAYGELLAKAAEGLSANIHSSIEGVIEEIKDGGALIRRKDG